MWPRLGSVAVPLSLTSPWPRLWRRWSCRWSRTCRSRCRDLWLWLWLRDAAASDAGSGDDAMAPSSKCTCVPQRVETMRIACNWIRCRRKQSHNHTATQPHSHRATEPQPQLQLQAQAQAEAQAQAQAQAHSHTYHHTLRPTHAARTRCGELPREPARDVRTRIGECPRLVDPAPMPMRAWSHDFTAAGDTALGPVLPGAVDATECPPGEGSPTDGDDGGASTAAASNGGMAVGWRSELLRGMAAPFMVLRCSLPGTSWC